MLRLAIAGERACALHAAVGADEGRCAAECCAAMLHASVNAGVGGCGGYRRGRPCCCMLR